MREGWLAAVIAGMALAGGVVALPAAAAPIEQSPNSREREAQTLEAQFDVYMKAAVANGQFSGTVLVAKDGVPVFRRAYGLASQELHVENTGETVYQLQSITKSFTAILIMMLQEDGKLSIDDRACDYLTDCPEAWGAITIRQLLTHTSGIESYSRLADWDETLDSRTYWKAGAALLMRDRPLLSAPGENYRYSNTGFDLLGLIVERAVGKPLPEVYRDRILKPLGMAHSGFRNTRFVVPGAATGYYSLGSTFISSTPQTPTSSYGSGGLYSTVDDLLIWDRALTANGLIPAAAYAQMIADPKNDYGLGWEVRTWLGRRQIGHAGSGFGFSTIVARFIDDGLTVIVLSNSDAANAGATARDLAAIYFGQDYQPQRPNPQTQFLDVILANSLEAGFQWYRDRKAAQPAEAAFQNDELLVGAGYELHGAPSMDEARRVFEFALEQFPQSAYSHDGLADVATSEGRPDIAIHHFEESLALDPTNDYAVKGLARLRESGSR